MASANQRVRDAHAQIANYAGEIADLFKPGAKVTILIRHPSLDEATMIVSDDTMDDAIAALTRLKDKKAVAPLLEDLVLNSL